MGLKQHTTNVIGQIADLIWPLRCCSCQVPLPQSPLTSIDRAFCRPCQEATLPLNQDCCPICSIPLNRELPNHKCGKCLSSKPPFERLVSVYEYGASVADAIAQLKYGKNTGLARPLGSLMTDRAAQIHKPELIVPVPLHPKKLRARGFNQAALLAGIVAGQLRVRVSPRLLKRTVDTTPQSRLGRRDRLSNMEGAFRATRPSPATTIWLVDDVATTCATLESATRALKEAGYKNVTCLTLARASC